MSLHCATQNAVRSDPLLRELIPAIPMNCHPDRSAAEWRDLLFTSEASNLNGSAILPFVIPSEAEGSAVSTDPSWKCSSTLLNQPQHSLYLCP